MREIHSTFYGGKMTLREQRTLFSKLVPRLIDHAFEFGYEVTIGDCYRDPRAPYGHPTSCHKVGLAIDLNLFKDGVYLETTESHQELGEYWESLDPLCRWGGSWDDGNHYSMEYLGMR